MYFPFPPNPTHTSISSSFNFLKRNKMRKNNKKRSKITFFDRMKTWQIVCPSFCGWKWNFFPVGIVRNCSCNVSDWKIPPKVEGGSSLHPAWWVSFFPLADRHGKMVGDDDEGERDESTYWTAKKNCRTSAFHNFRWKEIWENAFLQLHRWNLYQTSSALF